MMPGNLQFAVSGHRASHIFQKTNLNAVNINKAAFRYPYRTQGHIYSNINANSLMLQHRQNDHKKESRGIPGIINLKKCYKRDQT